jgi:hypothetical protein
MGLKKVFTAGVNTAFKVLKDLVYSATYTTVQDDGFSTATTTDYQVDVIIDSFSERDVQFLSFSELIQPQDVKGLLKGAQLPVFPSSRDLLLVTSNDAANGQYRVIASTTDPAFALYTILLRRV